MSEPLACCVHGVLELTRPEPGDLVVLSGPGAIGLLALQTAKVAGATVIVSGTDADSSRLEVAASLGADRVVNVQQEDLRSVVADLTGGLGADVVLECSGAEPAAALGIELVRRRGKYTQIGMFGRPITLDFEKIAYKEIQVTGSFAQKWSAWKKALRLVGEGRVKLKPLVGDLFPLRSWEDAFARMNRREGLKILLSPEA